jgi:hypothetical protein
MLMAICIVSLLSVSTASAQDGKKWYFGIGTGLSGTNLEGDMGLYSEPLGATIKPEVELDPGDFQDLVSTAFGLGGYATNTKWMITYKGGFIELEGDGSGTLPGGDSYATNIKFKITFFETQAGYVAYRSPNRKFHLQPYTGVRFTKHKIENDLTVNDNLSTFEHDNSWADLLLGTTLGYAFSPKWSWSLSADGGFGGSEGSFTGKTSITWKPHPHWSFSPNATFSSTEYENGEEGDTDWYLYDMDQTQFGLSFLYHF